MGKFYALAGGVLLALPVAVNAQSAITLYGITDVGLEYASHVPAPSGGSDNAFRMQSGNLSGSRWGMRGQESLGSDTKAIFVIESGFNLNNGSLAQGGRLFGRKAYVGIESKFGTLTLGRQNNLMYDLMYQFDALSFNPSYSAQSYDPALIGRADNSARYSVGLGGFTLAGLYSTGFDSTIPNGSQVPGATKVGREFSFAALYSSGAFNSGVTYDQMQGTSIATQSVTQMRVVAGGSLSIQRIKVFIGTRYLNVKNSASLPSSSLYWTGLSYQFSPPLVVSLGGYYERLRTSGRHAASGVVLADYFLSKTTDIYGEASYISNSAGLAVGVRSQGDVNPGGNQTGVTLGIRHLF
jgi:predicted porin